MSKEQDKSEYVLSTVGAEAKIEIHDVKKRMSFFLASDFAKINYDGKTYDISQAGAEFVIQGHNGKEAVVDIRPAFKAAVAALAAFEA